MCVSVWTTSSSDLKWNAPIYPRTRTIQPTTILALIVWRFVNTNSIHSNMPFIGRHPTQNTIHSVENKIYTYYTLCVRQLRTDQIGIFFSFVSFSFLAFHRKFGDVSMLTFLIEGEMPSVVTCSIITSYNVHCLFYSFACPWLVESCGHTHQNSFIDFLLKITAHVVAMHEIFFSFL